MIEEDDWMYLDGFHWILHTEGAGSRALHNHMVEGSLVRPLF